MLNWLKFWQTESDAVPTRSPTVSVLDSTQPDDIDSMESNEEVTHIDFAQQLADDIDFISTTHDLTNQAPHMASALNSSTASHQMAHSEISFINVTSPPTQTNEHVCLTDFAEETQPQTSSDLPLNSFGEELNENPSCFDSIHGALQLCSVVSQGNENEHDWCLVEENKDGDLTIVDIKIAEKRRQVIPLRRNFGNNPCTASKFMSSNVSNAWQNDSLNGDQDKNKNESTLFDEPVTVVVIEQPKRLQLTLAVDEKFEGTCSNQQIKVDTQSNDSSDPIFISTAIGNDLDLNSIPTNLTFSNDENFSISTVDSLSSTADSRCSSPGDNDTRFEFVTVNDISVTNENNCICNGSRKSFSFESDDNMPSSISRVSTLMEISDLSTSPSVTLPSTSLSPANTPDGLEDVHRLFVEVIDPNDENSISDHDDWLNTCEDLSRLYEENEMEKLEDPCMFLSDNDKYDYFPQIKRIPRKRDRYTSRHRKVTKMLGRSHY